ncbi:MAG: Na+/H+ antiporter subunit E [Halioglobus sp.]
MNRIADHKKKATAMRHTIYLGLTLVALWLSLSGFFTPLMLAFGLVSVITVLFISHRMDVVDEEGHPVHLRPHQLLLFWVWLLKRIVISNLEVARIVLSPALPISPTITRVSASSLSEVGRVSFANAITLTPGSLTIGLTPEGEATVHTLTRASARDLATSTLQQRLAAVEQGWQAEESD